MPPEMIVGKDAVPLMRIVRGFIVGQSAKATDLYVRTNVTRRGTTVIPITRPKRALSGNLW
jgi:hypothetical protein